jgi:hypothetical protein
MKLIVESGQGPFEIAWSFESQCYWILYHNVPVHYAPIKLFSHVSNLIHYLISKGM